MGAHHVIFNDRLHAGQLLTEKLASFADKPVLILGLARGGVVTAKPIAAAFGVVPEVLIIKKLASPYNSEFAIGAVAPDSIYVIHWSDAHRVGVDEEYAKTEVSRLSQEIKHLLSLYRKAKKPLQVAGKRIILVDDGAATGATMEAAILWARKKKAKEIIVALPVISKEAAAALKPEVDALITVCEEDMLESVGSFYTSFPQIEDGEVVRLLTP